MFTLDNIIALVNRKEPLPSLFLKGLNSVKASSHHLGIYKITLKDLCKELQLNLNLDQYDENHFINNDYLYKLVNLLLRHDIAMAPAGVPVNLTVYNQIYLTARADILADSDICQLQALSSQKKSKYTNNEIEVIMRAKKKIQNYNILLHVFETLGAVRPVPFSNNQRTVLNEIIDDMLLPRDGERYARLLFSYACEMGLVSYDFVNPKSVIVANAAWSEDIINEVIDIVARVLAPACLAITVQKDFPHADRLTARYHELCPVVRNDVFEEKSKVFIPIEDRSLSSLTLQQKNSRLKADLSKALKKYHHSTDSSVAIDSLDASKNDILQGRPGFSSDITRRLAVLPREFANLNPFIDRLQQKLVKDEDNRLTIPNFSKSYLVLYEDKSNQNFVTPSAITNSLMDNYYNSVANKGNFVIASDNLVPLDKEHDNIEHSSLLDADLSSNFTQSRYGKHPWGFNVEGYGESLLAQLSYQNKDKLDSSFELGGEQNSFIKSSDSVLKQVFLEFDFKPLRANASLPERQAFLESTCSTTTPSSAKSTASINQGMKKQGQAKPSHAAQGSEGQSKAQQGPALQGGAKPSPAEQVAAEQGSAKHGSAAQGSEGQEHGTKSSMATQGSKGARDKGDTLGALAKEGGPIASSGHKGSASLGHEANGKGVISIDPTDFACYSDAKYIQVAHDKKEFDNKRGLITHENFHIVPFTFDKMTFLNNPYLVWGDDEKSVVNDPMNVRPNNAHDYEGHLEEFIMSPFAATARFNRFVNYEYLYRSLFGAANSRSAISDQGHNDQHYVDKLFEIIISNDIQLNHSNIAAVAFYHALYYFDRYLQNPKTHLNNELLYIAIFKQEPYIINLYLARLFHKYGANLIDIPEEFYTLLAFSVILFPERENADLFSDLARNLFKTDLKNARFYKVVMIRALAHELYLNVHGNHHESLTMNFISHDSVKKSLVWPEWTEHISNSQKIFSSLLSDSFFEEICPLYVYNDLLMHCSNNLMDDNNKAIFHTKAYNELIKFYQDRESEQLLISLLTLNKNMALILPELKELNLEIDKYLKEQTLYVANNHKYRADDLDKEQLKADLQELEIATQTPIFKPQRRHTKKVAPSASFESEEQERQDIYEDYAKRFSHDGKDVNLICDDLDDELPSIPVWDRSAQAPAPDHPESTASDHGQEAAALGSAQSAVQSSSQGAVKSEALLGEDALAPKAPKAKSAAAKGSKSKSKGKMLGIVVSPKSVVEAAKREAKKEAQERDVDAFMSMLAKAKAKAEAKDKGSNELKSAQDQDSGKVKTLSASDVVAKLMAMQKDAPKEEDSDSKERGFVLYDKGNRSAYHNAFNDPNYQEDQLEEDYAYIVEKGRASLSQGVDPKIRALVVKFLSMVQEHKNDPYSALSEDKFSELELYHNASPIVGCTEDYWRDVSSLASLVDSLYQNDFACAHAQGHTLDKEQAQLLEELFNKFGKDKLKETLSRMVVYFLIFGCERLLKPLALFQGYGYVADKIPRYTQDINRYFRSIRDVSMASISFGLKIMPNLDFVSTYVRPIIEKLLCNGHSYFYSFNRGLNFSTHINDIVAIINKDYYGNLHLKGLPYNRFIVDCVCAYFDDVLLAKVLNFVSKVTDSALIGFPNGIPSDFMYEVSTLLNNNIGMQIVPFYLNLPSNCDFVDMRPSIKEILLLPIPKSFGYRRLGDGNAFKEKELSVDYEDLLFSLYCAYLALEIRASLTSRLANKHKMADVLTTAVVRTHNIEDKEVISFVYQYLRYCEQYIAKIGAISSSSLILPMNFVTARFIGARSTLRIKKYIMIAMGHDAQKFGLSREEKQSYAQILINLKCITRMQFVGKNPEQTIRKYYEAHNWHQAYAQRLAAKGQAPDGQGSGYGLSPGVNPYRPLQGTVKNYQVNLDMEKIKQKLKESELVQEVITELRDKEQLLAEQTQSSASLPEAGSGLAPSALASAQGASSGPVPEPAPEAAPEAAPQAQGSAGHELAAKPQEQGSAAQEAVKASEISLKLGDKLCKLLGALHDLEAEVMIYSEFNGICVSHGLISGNYCIEALNEYAFEVFDEPILEVEGQGNDATVYLTQDLISELNAQL